MDSHRIIICRCEEVSLDQVLETATQYSCTARELKLRTRAGMGCCGGRTCRPLLDQVLEAVSGQKPTHAVSLGYQPPVRPISFHLLGGGK